MSPEKRTDVIKVADFTGDSIPCRQQQEPWRWTRGPVPSRSDNECTLRSQALGADVHLPIESPSDFGAFWLLFIYTSKKWEQHSRA